MPCVNAMDAYAGCVVIRETTETPALAPVSTGRSGRTMKKIRLSTEGKYEAPCIAMPDVGVNQFRDTPVDRGGSSVTIGWYRYPGRLTGGPKCNNRRLVPACECALFGVSQRHDNDSALGRSPRFFMRHVPPAPRWKAAGQHGAGAEGVYGRLPRSPRSGVISSHGRRPAR